MRHLVVVDYGMGNLTSVSNAFARLGARCTISSDPFALRAASAIVLPGVGAFAAAMRKLRERGLEDALTQRVMGDKVPFLGICLGLQLVARDSTEHGHTRGLGWIDGHVQHMRPAADHPVPHVGWNQLASTGSPLFEQLPADAHFYFDHSFHLQCPADLVAATCEYGGRWVAAVHKDNVHAVQFHPEKSQRTGLRLLRNFLRYVEGATHA